MSVGFLLVVLAVVLVPGVDMLIVLRNTLAGGRLGGAATTVGIGIASVIQGTLVAFGVGAIIVQSQWLFQTLKWAGIAYLLFLGVTSLRSAFRRKPTREVSDDTAGDIRWTRGIRQGFLANITNPKMFVFYLSLLPQFIEPGAPIWVWLLHAWTLPAVGCVWLLIVAVLAATIRERLLRPLARRIIDAVSGIALVGFGARLATEN